MGDSEQQGKSRKVFVGHRCMTALLGHIRVTVTVHVEVRGSLQSRGASPQPRSSGGTRAQGGGERGGSGIHLRSIKGLLRARCLRRL